MLSEVQFVSMAAFGSFNIARGSVCFQEAQHRVFSAFGTRLRLIRQEFHVELYRGFFLDSDVGAFAGLVSFLVELNRYLGSGQLSDAKITVCIGQYFLQTV